MWEIAIKDLGQQASVIHYMKGENLFLSKYGVYRHFKTQIRKKFTYLIKKMHLKKVISIRQDNLGFFAFFHEK
jgi:hypothetical protein